MIAVNKTVVLEAPLPQHLTNEIIFSNNEVVNSEFLEPLLKVDWLDHDFVRKEKSRQGPGENGEPVILGENDAEISKLYAQDYSYNVLVSDRISLDRSIPDTRAPG